MASRVHISDVDSGETLGPGRTGELQIKGKHFMVGYKGNPTATQNTIGSDGWMKTGDIGYYNENGFVFVVDRLKELIKYNAFQVPPAELEAVILTHPGVGDVGVIGVPDEQAGELPHAWVVRRPGSQVTELELVNFVKDKVAPYKRLRGGVKFVSQIPKSSTGKILHRVMKAEMRKTKANI